MSTAMPPVPPTPPTPNPTVKAAMPVPPTPKVQGEQVQAEPAGVQEEEDVNALPHGSIWSNPRTAAMAGAATSVLLHAVLIIVGIIVLPSVVEIMKTETAEEQNVIPTAELATENPGGIPNPGVNADPTRQAMQNTDASVTQSDSWAETKSENLSSTLNSGGEGDSAPAIIGGGGKTGGGGGSGLGGGGALAKFGTPGGGMGIGPKGAVFGNGGNAYKIVFVCDGTGTMVGLKLSLVVKELQNTIGKLKPTQAYNVIFFYQDKESFATAVDPKKLIDATPANNRKSFEFLKNFSAAGSTNPIPAIEMAFKMKPQLIYMLSDGEFDNLVSYDEVEKTIQKLNADKSVKINTIMFGDRDAKAEQVLKRIAEGNGGKLASVSTDALLKQ